MIRTIVWAVLSTVLLLVALWFTYGAFTDTNLTPLIPFANNIGVDLQGVWGWVASTFAWGGVALAVNRLIEAAGPGTLPAGLKANAKLLLVLGVILWIESAVMATTSWATSRLSYGTDLIATFVGAIAFWWPFSLAFKKYFTLSAKELCTRAKAAVRAIAVLNIFFAGVALIGGLLKEIVIRELGQQFMSTPNNRGEIPENWLFNTIDALASWESFLWTFLVGLMFFGKKGRARLVEALLYYVFYQFTVFVLNTPLLEWIEDFIFYTIFAWVPPHELLYTLAAILSAAVAFVYFHHVWLGDEPWQRKASFVLILPVAAVTGCVDRMNNNIADLGQAVLAGFQSTIYLFGGVGMCLFAFWCIYHWKRP